MFGGTANGECGGGVLAMRAGPCYVHPYTLA